MGKIHDWVMHAPGTKVVLRGGMIDLTRKAKEILGGEQTARVDRDDQEHVFDINRKGHVTYPGDPIE